MEQMRLPNDLETLVQAHQEQLTSLKGKRAELLEQLEQLEKGIGLTEGAIIGLSQGIQALKQKEDDKRAATVDPSSVPELPTPMLDAVTSNGTGKVIEMGTKGEA